MKKLSIFFSYFFMSVSIVAQTTTLKNNSNDNFCNALKKIMAEAPGQFEKIKQGEDAITFNDPLGKRWIGIGWHTGFNFPGTILSYIDFDLYDPNSYIAFFGNFQTESEARVKLNFLNTELLHCLPDYNFKKYGLKYIGNPFRGYPEIFEYTGNKQGNQPPHVIVLQLKRDTSVYGVFLKIKGIDAETAEQKQENKKSLESISVNRPNLGKQLLELLNYSKEGFKTIKGEMINTKKSDPDLFNVISITNNYKTNYSLEGSLENSIEEYNRNEKYMDNPHYKFISLYGKDLSKQGGEEFYDKLLLKLKERLNKGYEFKEDLYEPGYGIYIKTMQIRPDGDKKHIISLEISFNPGMKGFELLYPDKAEVKITVEEFHY